MYLVTALAATVGPLEYGGPNVAYTSGESKLVADDAIGYYNNAGTSMFTVRQLTPALVGAKNGSTVTVTESLGTINRTTFTFTALPITMRDTEQGGGVKIYDFPAGAITFLGAKGSIAVTTTSILADTLNTGVTCNWGIGTATQSSATLATTQQNILNVTAFTASATINVAGAASAGVGAAGPTVASPVDAYLNLAVAGATDIDADATVTVTGTAVIYWQNLG